MIGKRILIIDDDHVLSTTIAKFLMKNGFFVKTDNDTYHALSTYRTFLPDLVLCDVDMPKMHWFEILKQIREVNSTQPFAMMTGSCLNPAELKVIRKQKITQIMKPPDMEADLPQIVLKEIGNRG